MDDDDVRAVIHRFVAATGVAGMQDMGRVMGEVMREVRGKADGRRVQELVRETLAGPRGGG
jgi:uncharacterized protein YqeY